MHHRYGMMLFIASEVMLFVGCFWAYFDGFFRLDDVEQYARVAATSGVWPPTGVELFDPFHLPLFNTLILLTSGTTVTWAHHALLEGDRKGLEWGLVLTMCSACCSPSCSSPNIAKPPSRSPATCMAPPSSWRRACMASMCIIGTIFLLVCLIRALRGEFTPEKPPRLRICRLVLALRRRGLAVPVRLDLCVG